MNENKIKTQIKIYEENQISFSTMFSTFKKKGKF